MIDSIVLHFNIAIPSIANFREWAHRKEGEDGQLEDYYVYNGPKFPTEVTPTRISTMFFPRSKYTKRPLLIVTVGSAQKLIFGNNYQNSTDIKLIINKINDQLNKIPGLELIDAGEGLLRRVDFCKNHYVGNCVADYIEFINRLDYDHRNKCCYANKNKKPYKIDFLDKRERFNGVVFASKSISTSFYDKEKECHDPRARGILRHEVRIIGKKKIAKCTGLPDPKLKDLTPGMAEAIFKKDLARLGLDREIPNEESVRDQLIKAHGARKGSKLLSYLRSFNDHPGKTKKQIAEAEGVSYDTILTRWSELEKAGVTPSIAPRSVKLPRLTEFLVEADDGKKPIKVLGDTKTADNVAGDPVSTSRQPGDLLANFRPRGIDLQ